MPLYAYIALDPSERKVRGALEAGDLETAKASLRAAGLTLLDIRPRRGLHTDLPWPGRPSAKALAVFCRQFRSTLRAGVSVAQVLALLAAQTENRALRRAVRAMEAAVVKGETLAGAMGRHPEIFPALLVRMVRAGEGSGALEDAFHRAELYFDRLKRTEAKARKAMTYPCVLLLATAVVFIVMLVKILPMFLEAFLEMDASLPGLTRAVMALSGWLTRRWWVLALLVAGGALLMLALGKTDRGQRLSGRLALGLPLFGPLTEKAACAALCRSLSILLGAGLTLSEALELTAGSMTNLCYREALRRLRVQIAGGVSLTAGLRQQPRLFPAMVCSLVGIGEETGALEEMLGKAADYYEDEVAEATDRLLSLLEPCVILLMAGMVTALVLAVFLPILSMTQAYDRYL